MKKHDVRGESCARTGMNSPSAVWRPSPQVYRYALTLGSTTCAWSSYVGDTQQRQCLTTDWPCAARVGGHMTHDVWTTASYLRGLDVRDAEHELQDAVAAGDDRRLRHEDLQQPTS
jgi:hypothetical protein